jgi:hypothetical protein
MSLPPPLCTCDVCLTPEPELYVAPLAQLKAVRERDYRREPRRVFCPRCGERLGITESLVDSVGYAHFVQPCAGCAALWVIS